MLTKKRYNVIITFLILSILTYFYYTIAKEPTECPTCPLCKPTQTSCPLCKPTQTSCPLPSQPTTTNLPRPNSPTFPKCNCGQCDTSKSNCDCDCLTYTTIKTSVVRTRTDPSFTFVGTKDGTYHGLTDKNVIQFGVWGSRETSIFKEILKDRCNSKTLVVDVGANMGYFALYSAAFGCKVKAYEPQPGAYQYLSYGVGLNDFGYLIEANHLGVYSDNKGIQISTNQDWSIASKADGGYFVGSVTLLDEIKQNVLLLKIDVEGFEDHVLKNFEKVLENYDVENIVCETKNSVGDVNEKRMFINNMMNNYNYVVLSYEELVLHQNVDPIDNLKCIELDQLQEKEWFPYEDLWYIKKDSETYKRVKDKIKCLD
jgi:FkbM family methyltransferase